jgi:hypothetical protein
MAAVRIFSLASGSVALSNKTTGAGHVQFDTELDDRHTYALRLQCPKTAINDMVTVRILWLSVDYKFMQLDRRVYELAWPYLFAQ